MENNGPYQENNENKKALIIGSLMGTVFLAIVFVCVGIAVYKTTNNKMATAYISNEDSGYNTIEPTGQEKKDDQKTGNKDVQYYAVSDYSGIDYDNSIDCHRSYTENGIDYYEESSFLFKNEQLIYNQQFWACKSANFTESAKDEVLTELNKFGEKFEGNGYNVVSSKEANFVYLKATFTVAPKDQLIYKDFSIEYVKDKYSKQNDDNRGNYQCDTKDSM